MVVFKSKIEETIPHTCDRCGSSFIFPESVSTAEEGEKVLFQCPACETDGEIDISGYPRVDVRIVVNEWHDSIYAQGGC